MTDLFFMLIFVVIPVLIHIGFIIFCLSFIIYTIRMLINNLSGNSIDDIVFITIIIILLCTMIIGSVILDKEVVSLVLEKIK
jgi:hypothetical protein